MSRRRAIGLTIVLVAVTAQAAGALACPMCSCMRPGDNPVAEVVLRRARATVVFLGEVTQIGTKSGTRCARARDCEVREPDPDSEWYWEDVQVTFEVERGWKGLSSFDRAVTVRTHVHGSTCGYNFELGRRYLVYAHWNESTERLRTGLCSGNQPIDSAGFHLGVLGKPTVQFGG